MKIAFEADLPVKEVAALLQEKMSDNDVLKVVRCKNCKNWNEETKWCNEHSYFIDSDSEPCHPSESRNWKMFEPDYYCGSGERKDETEEN